MKSSFESAHSIDPAPGARLSYATVRRGTERILTTDAGSLARPDDLRDLLVARDTGRPYDRAFASRPLWGR
jgi:hypothetical protein